MAVKDFTSSHVICINKGFIQIMSACYPIAAALVLTL